MCLHTFKDSPEEIIVKAKYIKDRLVEMKKNLGVEGVGYELCNIFGHHGSPMKKMFHFKSSEMARKT